MSKRMEKIKNILSPGRSSDDDVMYDTNRPEDFTSSPEVGDKAAREAAQRAAVGYPSDHSHTQAAEHMDGSSSTSANSGMNSGKHQYTHSSQPPQASAAARGAAQQAAAGASLESSRVQYASARDDVSAASIKSGVVGGLPSQQQPHFPPQTAAAAQGIPPRTHDQDGKIAALAAATTASAGVVGGELHAQTGPKTQTTIDNFGEGHHEGYAHVQPAATARRVSLSGGPRPEVLEEAPQFANRPPPQYDPHGRHDLAEAAAAASGTYAQNTLKSQVKNGPATEAQPNPSATAAAHTAMTEPMDQTASRQKMEGHVGRDITVAGAGAATAAGATYAIGHGRDTNESATGPASHTTGPHKSNILNILDPRVQPNPQKMKQEPLVVESADTGPAPRTIGPHSSDVLNIVDPRVQPDPAKMKTSDSVDPVGKAELRDVSNLPDTRLRSDGTETLEPRAENAFQPTTGMTSKDNAPLAGLAAGAITGAGLASSRGETETSKRFSDRGTLSDVRSGSYEGGWKNPYSSAPLDPRLDDMPGGFPETPANELQAPPIEGNNSMATKKENATMPIAASYSTATGNEQVPQTDTADLAANENNVTPTQTKADDWPLRPHENQDKHLARDAALGAGAGALGIGAVEAVKHHETGTSGSNTTQVQEPDILRGAPGFEGSDVSDFTGGTRVADTTNVTSTPTAAAAASESTKPESSEHHGVLGTSAAGLAGAGIASAAVAKGSSNDDDEYDPFKYDTGAKPPSARPSTSVTKVYPPSTVPPKQSSNTRDAAIVGGVGASGIAGVGAYEALKNDGATKQENQNAPTTSVTRQQPYEEPKQHHYARDANFAGGAGAAAVGAYELLKDDGATKQYHPSSEIGVMRVPQPGITTGTTGQSTVPAAGSIYPDELKRPHQHRPTTAETAGGLMPDSETGETTRSDQNHMGRDAGIAGATGAAGIVGTTAVYEAQKRGQGNPTGSSQVQTTAPSSTRDIYGADAAQPHYHSPTSAETAGGVYGDSTDGQGTSPAFKGLATTGGLAGAGVAGHDYAVDHPPSAAQQDPVAALQAATSRRFEDQRADPIHQGHEVDPVTGDAVDQPALKASDQSEQQVRQAHSHGLAGATGGAAAGYALHENDHKAGQSAVTGGPLGELVDTVRHHNQQGSPSMSSSKHSEEASASPKQKKHRFSSILHRKSRSRDLNEEHKADHLAGERQSVESGRSGLAQEVHRDNAGAGLGIGDAVSGSGAIRPEPELHPEGYYGNDGKSALASKSGSQSGRNRLHKEPPASWKEAYKGQSSEQ